MRKREPLAMVNVRLTASQLKMLDAEVARQRSNCEDIAATRSSVMRQALMRQVAPELMRLRGRGT